MCCRAGAWARGTTATSHCFLRTSQCFCLLWVTKLFSFLKQVPACPIQWETICVTFSLVPPTFLSPEPEILDSIPGGEIILNCTATGNPTPIYSWQSSTPMQERVENEATVTSSSLLPGTYTCTASNTLEKKSKQFIVKAKTKGRREKWGTCATCLCTLQPNCYLLLLSPRRLKQPLWRGDRTTTSETQREVYLFYSFFFLVFLFCFVFLLSHLLFWRWRCIFMRRSSYHPELVLNMLCLVITI